MGIGYRAAKQDYACLQLRFDMLLKAVLALDATHHEASQAALQHLYAQIREYEAAHPHVKPWRVAEDIARVSP